VFVVINIVRDNPSFFVAYFLFTQEFILNLYLSINYSLAVKKELYNFMCKDEQFLKLNSNWV
ncbi:hypothetical protein EFR54_07680, partial [Lactobacillus delbrueckii subsp. lactis]|nr:hypothetical protein [Lactobacillus delbrueckii subsp. lactis]